MLGSKIELLEAEGKPVAQKDRDKMAEYKKEQDQIFAEAKEKEHRFPEDGEVLALLSSR